MKVAFPEDAQYLYNYRQIGKLWRLPRNALLIRSATKDAHCDANDSPSRDEPIYAEPQQVAMKSRQCSGSVATDDSRLIF